MNQDVPSQTLLGPAMTEPPAVTDEPRADSTWPRIDELVDRVQALVATGGEEEPFYAALLDAALRATAAVSGAVWSVAAGDELKLLVEAHDGQTPWSAGGTAAWPHERFLRDIVAAGQAGSVPPGASDARGPINVSPYLLLACPVVLDERSWRIVEVCQRPETSTDAMGVCADVLRTLCELAADFHRRARLRELQTRECWWQKVSQFCAEVQRPLDLPSVAYTVTNEARRLLDADRVTLAVRRRGRLRVQAISGLDTFDPRATSIRQLERLADRVAAMAEPLVYRVGGPAVAPELEAAAEEYVDQTHVRSLAAIPLVETAADGRPPIPPHSVLVVESFVSTSDGPDRDTLDIVCRHTRLAVARAVRYERIPAVRMWERLADGCRPGRWARTALWALPLAAAVAALVFVPAEFRVTCRGRLKPQVERRIFAPRDGRVEQLSADHGDAVVPGQLLATLHSSELEYEDARLAGEMQTTMEQLQAVQTARLGAQPSTADQRGEYVRQTGEEERLKKVLASLREQRELLDRERQTLQIRSPIAGGVLTWDLTDSLQQRPVKRGQLLMTVADIRGPWVLELQIPDRDAGYVLAARQTSGQELPVCFYQATAPSQTYEGRLEKLAEIAEVDPQQQLSVAALVRVETAALPHRLAGAGVVARITCGRRALGYVWLHDLIEAVRGWLFM